jgi:hypothetical protein
MHCAADSSYLRARSLCTIKFFMRKLARVTAALELLLFPAALFLIAIVVRNLQPLQYEPAHTAQRIVLWYSARIWTLWVLLLALPFAVLVSGSATVLSDWNRDTDLANFTKQSSAVVRAHKATLLVAVTTLAAAGILVIVVLHMLAN